MLECPALSGQHPVWPGHSHVLRASAPPQLTTQEGTRGQRALAVLAFPLPQCPQAVAGHRPPGASHSLTVEGQNSSLLGPKA